MTLLSRSGLTGYYKKTLTAVCLCITLFASGGFVGGQKEAAQDTASTGERFEPQKRVQFKNSNLPYGRRFPAASCGELQYFNDFIVHLKDNSRPDRLLLCDMVVELNRNTKLPEDGVGLRKIIYQTLKGMPNLPEARDSLKAEIKISLNNFMGDEIIKTVYFTKFVLF